MSLLLPDAPSTTDAPLHRWITERLLPLASKSEDEQRASIVQSWRELGGTERFIWNKLITGGFRVGVSQQLVVRALSRATGVDEGVIAHRLSGTWEPRAESFTALLAAETADADVSRPYPFFLAYALEDELESLGEPTEWQVEWKWDGIRAQVIRREGQTFIWSRGEELVTDRFPEIAAAAEFLPDGTVLDGEIMPWKDGKPLPFAQLQRRIGRKSLRRKDPERSAGRARSPTICWRSTGAMCDTEPLAWRRAMMLDVHRRGRAARRSFRRRSWRSASGQTRARPMPRRVSDAPRD